MSEASMLLGLAGNTANLIGGATSTLGSVINTHKSNSDSRERQADALAWDYWQWQQQNQYNSPQNQMKLLSDAGLNPYLYAKKYSGASSGANAIPYTATQRVDLGYGDAANHANNTLSRMAQFGLQQQAQARMDRADARDEAKTQATVLNKELMAERLKRARLENQSLKTQMQLNKDNVDLKRIETNAKVNSMVNRDRIMQGDYDIRKNSGNVSDYLTVGGTKLFGYESRWQNKDSNDSKLGYFFYNY